MFDTLEGSKLSWFRPISYEPNYRFEMLGVLAFLAVHNGFVLPVSFPIAFYMKLFGLPAASLDVVHDGWPELANGLQQMIDWDESNGRVEDIFMTDYVFTIDTGGAKINVQIDKFAEAAASWPDEHLAKEYGYSQNNPPPPKHCAWIAPRGTHLDRVDSEGNKSSAVPAPQTVNGQNRENYVMHYLWFLVHQSIDRQFQAFARGFFKCISEDNVFVSQKSSKDSLRATQLLYTLKSNQIIGSDHFR